MAELGICWELDGLGSGRYRRVQHLKPIAYNDAGTLRRIVSDWVDSGIAERPHIVTASRLMTSVADDGMRRIHPTREADRYMEIGAPYVKVSGVWRKVSFANSVRTANLLAWTRPEANLAIIHAGHYIKLGMELKGGYVPEGNLVAFPVGLTGLTRTGAQIKADGATVALLRAPEVYDAANPEDVRPISWRFTTLDSQPYLLLTLPSLAGMTRPVVDPTLDVQPDASAGIDTVVRSGDPTVNYGTATTWEVNVTGNRALFKFDLSSLAGATITSATLKLAILDACDWGSAAGGKIHRILSASGSWTEAGATWNYQTGTTRWAGDTDNNGGANAGCSVSGTDYSSTAMCSFTVDDTWTAPAIKSLTLDTTEFASMVAANYGFVMWGLDGGDIAAAAFSDHGTASARPQLVVEYSAAASGNPWYAYAQQ